MLAIYEISGKALNVPTFTLQMFQKKKREKKTESVFEEIMPQKQPKLKKKTDTQVQEAQRVPNKINPNRPAPRYAIIIMAVIKENSKGSKRKSYIQENLSKATI